jgi:hypothetical protein
MTHREMISLAADCLLGIDGEVDYHYIKSFLDWQLDNLDDLPEGYPVEVMTREHEAEIMAAVECKLDIRDEEEPWEEIWGEDYK